nr:uncharacterized protein LOC123761344 [Procambarus clarkii]
MVVPKTVLLLLILQDAVGEIDYSLWCYECGTGVAGEPDCEAFAHASSWASFWRKCPKDHICVKTVPSWASSDESRMVRGCSPGANLRGTPLKTGCWSTTNSPTIMCFCDTDRCNAARTPTVPALTVAALLALGAVVR